MKSHDVVLLSAPALASRLGCSVFTVSRRTDLPPPVRLAGRKLFFASDVQHLFPRRRPYRDVINADELAGLLFVAIPTLYRLVKQGTIPRPQHDARGRARWSRRDVEQHLRALPSDRVSAVATG